MRPRERAIRQALGFKVPPAASTAATEVARAVRLAIDQSPEDSPFPPNIHGCIEVAAAMAWPAVAKHVGLSQDEFTSEAVIAYLMRGWWEMCVSFDREHFEAERADWENAQKLAALAQEREGDVLGLAGAYQ